MIFVVFLVFLAQTILCDPWTWGQVTIGGGGYVLGLVAHPTEPDLVYSRCDVGGIYRYDFDAVKWIPLVDIFGPAQKNLYGGESIAIDPSNPDILYAAVGMYSYWGNGDVIKSYDRGATWEFTNLNVTMGGNEDLRWAGERLAVDPKNSSVVFFGSRYDGLWVSKTGGGNWEKTSLSNGTFGYGVVFVQFDSAQNYIYAGVAGDGVYLSGDGGETWKLLQGSPTHPLRAAIVPSTFALLVTSPAGVYKWANSTWENISPNTSLYYCGISTHPTDPNFIIVAQQTPGFGDGLFRSTDGGKTWENIFESAVVSHQPTWWPQNYFSAATAVFYIDPVTPELAYLTTWYGTYFCDDITAAKTVWYANETGHEEVFAIAMHSNGGVLLVGTADVAGFRIPSSDFSQFPAITFNYASQYALQDTTSIDSAFNNPNLVVRVGTTQWTNPPSGGGGYSKDNGATWNQFPTYPVANNYTIGGIIAISADGGTIIWWPFQNQAFYSSDFGSTWMLSNGSPFNNASCCHASVGIDAAYPVLLQADKVNSSIFYIFSQGTLFTSTDSGKSFAKTGTIPFWDPSLNMILLASPTTSGEVWVSTGGPNGLWKSSNFGAIFTRVQPVTSCLLFTFGKNAENGQFPALYVMGTIGSEESVFISNDLGSTWDNIGNNSIKMGDSPWSMTADPATYGQVFIGTLGRGVYVGSV